jgi:hypothetical protein
MPVLPIPIIAWLKFASHSLKLPTQSDWKQPSNSDHYGKGLKPADKIAIPKCMPPMFSPQNQNKYHQDSCDSVGQSIQIFIAKMCGAIAFSHAMNKMQAKFQNLKVAAVSAIGAPGCLDFPDLENLIKYSPLTAMMSGNEAKWRDAVAKGVASCFKDYAGKVTVPGLPWYPAFAAFPGPMAPPMPNVPMPLIACISPMMTKITVPGSMKDAMGSAPAGSDPDDQFGACADGIDAACCLAFLIWMPIQLVNLVLGKGPIPTFAPPFVPVGPVVGGDNIATPGHLMSP